MREAATASVRRQGRAHRHSEIRRGSLSAGLSQARRKIESRGHTGEQRLPWSIPVAIELYEGLDVLLLVRSLEAVRKPFPLISNEPLEASTAVEEGSVKIEDHGLNIRSHLFSRAVKRVRTA